MRLETERLLLRPFDSSDATSLYKYASNPKIGPQAGWPAHTSVEESREIIQTVLTGELIFAIVYKDNPDEVIGCIDLNIGKRDFMSEAEGEIGYWIAEAYWGKGLVPEAVRAVLNQGFDIIGLDYIWCAAFTDNLNSKRVQEKIGFNYIKTLEDVEFKLINQMKTEDLSRLSRSEWHAIR